MNSSRRGGDALLTLTSTGALESGEVGIVDVAGDVIPVEARGVESRDLRVHTETGLQEVLDGLVNQTVGAERLTDLFLRLLVGDEFLARRHVDAVHVRVSHRRRGGGEVHLDGAGGAAHLHDLVHRRPANDGIVDEQHSLTVEHGSHRVQFTTNGEFARALVRHDEGATDVPILHQALAVRQLERGSHLDGARTRSIGHGDDGIDLPASFVDALGQTTTELELELVDRDAVDLGIRARQVNVFKDARRDGTLHALTRDHLTLVSDQDGLARVHVAHNLKAQRTERGVFARDAPFVLAVRVLALPQDERTNTVRIAKGKHTLTVDE